MTKGLRDHVRGSKGHGSVVGVCLACAWRVPGVCLALQEAEGGMTRGKAHHLQKWMPQRPNISVRQLPFDLCLDQGAHHRL